jgi:hypothetical protein
MEVNFKHALSLLKKATRDAGPQHEGDRKSCHPHRPGGLTAFSVTLMFWACVTLGFCNSVYLLNIHGNYFSSQKLLIVQCSRI